MAVTRQETLLYDKEVKKKSVSHGCKQRRFKKAFQMFGEEGN